MRQERAQQDMTLFMMSQFFQNPDGAEKLIPAMQKLIELGQAQQLAQEEQSKPSGGQGRSEKKRK